MVTPIIGMLELLAVLKLLSGGSVEKLVSRLSRPVSSHARHVDTLIADEILENHMPNVGTSCWLFQKIKNVKSKV